MMSNTKSHYTQDDAIRDILEMIDSHCVDNTVQSFYEIGEDLKKIGISTKKMRELEWEKLRDWRKEC